jgi:hypothetical protein
VYHDPSEMFIFIGDSIANFYWLKGEGSFDCVFNFFCLAFCGASRLGRRLLRLLMLSNSY